MSASGKSRNRLSEYNRGYFTGSGHGPYAAQGIEDRRRHDELLRQQPPRDDSAEPEDEDREAANDAYWAARFCGGDPR